MNLTEARKTFPIGSFAMIKYKGGHYSTYDKWAAKHMSSVDFYEWKYTNSYPETGDIGKVIAVAPHGSYEDAVIVAVKVEGKKPFMMNADDMEPYEQPFDRTAIPQKNEETPCTFKTCDGSKGYEVVFNGTSLIVTAHGETVGHNVEELLDEIASECFEKSRKIKEGDIVRIVDGDESYPCYLEWLKDNLSFDQALRFDWENSPKKGDEAKVLIIAPHMDFGHDLYLVEIEHDDVSRLYLMTRSGIEKI